MLAFYELLILLTSPERSGMWNLLKLCSSRLTLKQFWAFPFVPVGPMTNLPGIIPPQVFFGKVWLSFNSGCPCHWEPSMGGTSMQAFWTMLRNVDIPPRLKMFACRAVSNSLPSKSAWASKTRGLDATCGVCGSLQESDVHAIFECLLR